MMARGNEGADRAGDPFDTAMARPAWVRVLVAIGVLLPLWGLVLWAVQAP